MQPEVYITQRDRVRDAKSRLYPYVLGYIEHQPEASSEVTKLCSRISSYVDELNRILQTLWILTNADIQDEGVDASIKYQISKLEDILGTFDLMVMGLVAKTSGREVQ